MSRTYRKTLVSIENQFGKSIAFKKLYYKESNQQTFSYFYGGFKNKKKIIGFHKKKTKNKQSLIKNVVDYDGFIEENNLSITNVYEKNHLQGYDRKGLKKDGKKFKRRERKKCKEELAQSFRNVSSEYFSNFLPVEEVLKDKKLLIEEPSNWLEDHNFFKEKEFASFQKHIEQLNNNPNYIPPYDYVVYNENNENEVYICFEDYFYNLISQFYDCSEDFDLYFEDINKVHYEKKKLYPNIVKVKENKKGKKDTKFSFYFLMYY